ncbi:PVC-type heme-binding CxxCH protein [Pontibacter sp. G13]|uniref:PVC-type heme-binding CxxCH protein n=1 Tax=Pontibacter sp. G13 TaxID=3074898 RepID=UPI002889733A|nr:PVC-type heme-binding CxxCH protein [Pontibacter sp. G13]WNJ21314.1 HEAT repeat domain-containing protein [Pontibacter sp. G13]
MLPYARLILGLMLLGMLSACQRQPILDLQPQDHIVLLGNNLPARMMEYGFFETECHVLYPNHHLLIRNMGDGGNTPGFRPHSGRDTPWAFPGAAAFQTDLARPSGSKGDMEYPDEWLTRLSADVLICFFGYGESFGGLDQLPLFQQELAAFLRHSLQQTYNGSTPPKLVLVGPQAFEDLSSIRDLPNGSAANHRLNIYTKAMKQIADSMGIPFVDLFHESQNWYLKEESPCTIDGFQFNEAGNQKLAQFLAKELLGSSGKSSPHRDLIQSAVQEKNWMWHNDFKIPNGVHVFGRRHKPFGPDNYPQELKKIREMTAIRDSAIWLAAQGIELDLESADGLTSPMPTIASNYRISPDGPAPRYLYGAEALESMTMAEGFKIELFASEEMFEELANPLQVAFDDRGRLWVAVAPSYPHYQPGHTKPNDKLLILEDTDGDGRADKQTIWADGLHLPMGFELTQHGVFISQGTHLKLLRDTDGDDHADTSEIVLSGFDDHDTHHVISAFCADPSGAIYMGEGLFLHSNVETPYGVVRATQGGFFRYDPNRGQLERTAQISIPNPWGTAFDEWGQPFFLSTSGPAMRWLMPSTIRPEYGKMSPMPPSLIPQDYKVRPTSGLEFISSRHFPEEVQGDLLLGNVIGFRGVRQHQISEAGTGYELDFRQDLVSSSDPNFRPVDFEFAPDGSLYLADWHNMLIGHMQHNARDPYRDHAHGRIYRITYPSRPLIKPTQIADASIRELLDVLKSPEYRTRYRAKRALRGRDPQTVIQEITDWVHSLNPSDPQYERHLLEALWVSWGLNRIDRKLLQRLLQSEDHRVRAAAVMAVRYNGHQLPYQIAYLKTAAADPHGRVRLSAVVAASWLNPETALEILEIAEQHPVDPWMKKFYRVIKKRNTPPDQYVETNPGQSDEVMHPLAIPNFKLGKSIYHEEGNCVTCHQEDGKGLPASGFPPIAKSEWVTGNPETLIKITLKGLMGPIQVSGKSYPGQVPMTPFGGMLNDTEVAAVLNYVRNSFGNKAAIISEDQVKAVRAQVSDKEGFYLAKELNP